MAKHLTHTITYPKPIAEAWADLHNPAFQQGKLEFAGAKDVRITISDNDDGSMRVVLDRLNPVTGVPGAVKKLTGEWQHVIETVDWGPDEGDGTRTAALDVDFAGIPLAMAGSLRLAPNGAVTSLTIDADFKSSVPLIGGKLESTAAEQSAMSMNSEAKFSGQFTG